MRGCANAVLLSTLLSGCSADEAAPYPSTTPAGEGEGVGEGEGEGPVTEGEGEGVVGEGEGEGAEGEGSVDGEGEGAEGEGPVCACVSDADCDDRNFCNGAETCDCTCSPGTPLTCADEFECTEDRCANNECVNVPAHARCGAGKICRPAEGGCVAPPPCRDDADCVPDDPCQVGACEAATRSCAFAPFDGDEDGHAPIVCGGDDCDDSMRGIHPEASESCNEEDDNCNGQVDEGFDLRADRRNCGECGNECDADLICVNGNCDCRPGLSFCGERDGFRGEGEGEGEGVREICVDLNINTNHCGSCENECSRLERCIEGSCRCEEDLGGTLCGDRCINLQWDDNNDCGECGHACPIGADCQNGNCTCDDNSIVCNGACVASDENNCGACGNRCATGAECIRNECECFEYPLDNQWGDFNACEGQCIVCDEADRGSTCRLVTYDNDNCGECGRRCENVYSTCNNGICECTYLECNEVCVSPADRNNCGRCGNRCDLDEFGVQLGCFGNDCIPCEGWFGDDRTYCITEGDAPNPDWSNVVCTNRNFDRANCGGCRTACADNELCIWGQCVPRECEHPCRENEQCVEGECRGCPNADEQFCATVCRNVQNDPANCGRCGNICHGNMMCLNGNCTCWEGTVDCNGECVNTQTNRSNCGVCGNRCPLGSNCQNGQCSECVWLWNGRNERCNGDCIICDMANVVEGFDRVCSITATDEAHCGECGNQCAMGADCDNGECICHRMWEGGFSCEVEQCVICDGMADLIGGDGRVCSVPRVDNMNCGQCGNRCPEDRFCLNSRCQRH